MQPEIELKLDLEPDQAAAFLAWPGVPPEPAVATLHATYFDTPDRALVARGVSLRIRRSGRRRIQTVKASGKGGAGLFARDEWERPVRGNAPVLDDRNPVAGLLGGAVAMIVPVFTVEVERRTWMVPQDDAMIELVLDTGLIRADGREEAICEIELELKAGDPSALFTLARRIDADVPVRPGVLTKSDRGYRLRDALPGAFKAEPVALDPAISIADAFAHVMAACLRQYRLNEALLLGRYHPDALHQARVAVRRMRSALTLFRPVLAKADVARFQSELRWLAHALGEARDIDVLMTQRPQPDPQHARLAEAQVDVHGRVIAWLHAARVRMLLLDLVAWIAAGPVQRKGERPAAPFAAKRLRRYRRRIVKGGRHLERLTDEARHAVRKDGKKLRYGAEFFAGLFDGKGQQHKRPKFMAALARMQEELGALNDLVSAPDTLARYGLPAAPMPTERDALLKAAASAQADFADRQAFWR